MANNYVGAKEEFQRYFILLQKSTWFNTISGTSQLGKIIASCGRPADEQWEYELTKLEFNNIDLQRHIRPTLVNQKIKSAEALSKLTLSISCDCSSSKPDDNLKDPIKSLALKIVVQFQYLDESIDDLKTLQSSWHFDKHDSTKTVSSVHPLYHFEYGGSEINKADKFNYGDFILLDTPRLMHLPLDIVLAIDFIIKNYYQYPDHHKLTSTQAYIRCIENARFRIWRPYSISLASLFHNFGTAYSIDPDFTRNIVECPQN